MSNPSAPSSRTPSVFPPDDEPGAPLVSNLRFPSDTAPAVERFASSMEVETPTGETTPPELKLRRETASTQLQEKHHSISAPLVIKDGDPGSSQAMRNTLPDLQTGIDSAIGSVSDIVENVAQQASRLAKQAASQLPASSDSSSPYSPSSIHSFNQSNSTHRPSLKPPPLIPTILLSIPLISIYIYTSLPLAIVICAGVWWIWADGERRKAKRGEDPMVGRDRVRGPPVGDEDRTKEESVEWMNHAMKALFPLISTDLLTPVLDLLEDALLQEVPPPLLNSARISSPSLGREPIRIVSMRPMSDAEWFANLSRAESAPGDGETIGKLNRFNPFQGFERNKKVRLQRETKDRVGGRANGDGRFRKDEKEERARRDKILRTVGGTRGQGIGVGAARNRGQEGDEGGQFRTGVTSTEKTSVRGDGGGSVRTENDLDEDEDELEAGQYVNYAVDFTYDGRKNKGFEHSLHFCIYMGIGLPGFVGAEIPIWTEMLKIQGTLHVRLLLSPTTPFVRTGILSMPDIPEFDFKATPIRKNLNLDFMAFPLVKPFIEKSIRKVADAFVRPNCYSLDLDRLLLGREASLRTAAIGALHIKIHRAKGLRSSDVIGSSDPYCVIGFTKYNKPLFSTRIIVNTTNPRWEEDAYILVIADAVESGERVRLTIYDSDRFSSDDALGMIDRDLAEMLDESTRGGGSENYQHREDLLVPTQKGLACQGVLQWSYRFAPLWKLTKDSQEKKDIAEKEWDREKHSPEDIGTGREPSTTNPGLMYRLFDRMVPEPLPWEADRKKRRLESLSWLTGAASREALEATMPPSPERLSGVLQIAIVQAIELEVQGQSGTYNQGGNREHKGANGGAPALAQQIDMGAEEAKVPPSAYCEIILNGKLIYRTRTKHLSATPYWNAMTERLIRDWTKAKLTIVVRDERNRENDPILGIVTMDLASVFFKGSQITRAFPLVAGQGYGALRLSLLFKSLDSHLPAGISGYEVGTLNISSLRFQTSSAWDLSKLCISAETDVDHSELSRKERPGHTRTASNSSLVKVMAQTSRSPRRQGNVVDWDLETGKGVLAVQYRHSCFALLRFYYKHGKLRKDEVLGIAALRLCNLPDNEDLDFRLPIYLTDDVNKACDLALDREVAMKDGGKDPQEDLPMVEVDLAFHAGLSRVHEKLTKADKRLQHVYEAWEMAQDLGSKASYEASRSRGNQLSQLVLDEDQEAVNEEEGAQVENTLPPGEERAARGDFSIDHLIQAGDQEDDMSFWQKRKEKSKALHRQNKGVMQSKVFRTAKMIGDRLEEKGRKVGDAFKQTKHEHGSDLAVEMEGQSSL